MGHILHNMTSLVAIIFCAQFVTVFASNDYLEVQADSSGTAGWQRKRREFNDELDDTAWKLQRKEELIHFGSFCNYSYMFQVNRDRANELCEQNGMRLVSVASDEELDYLGSILPRSRYWTLGKSTNTYKWNGGSGEVVTSPVYVFNRISCVVFYWSVANATNLYGDPCDGSLASNYRMLCEAFI